MDLKEYATGHAAGMKSKSGDPNPYAPYAALAQGWNAGARDARANRRKAAIEANAQRLYSELSHIVDTLSDWGDIACTHDAQDLINDIEDAAR